MSSRRWLVCRNLTFRVPANIIEKRRLPSHDEWKLMTIFCFVRKDGFDEMFSARIPLYRLLFIYSTGVLIPAAAQGIAKLSGDLRQTNA